ncbi:MAG: hypothetical protein V7K25_07330 [Nostoc sp.]|uniref:hypothetical protein n=1 Tax=Nostoc sp. TaxID=1180 RepID=UPI002FF7CBB1
MPVFRLNQQIIIVLSTLPERKRYRANKFIYGLGKFLTFECMTCDFPEREQPPQELRLTSPETDMNA